MNKSAIALSVLALACTETTVGAYVESVIIGIISQRGAAFGSLFRPPVTGPVGEQGDHREWSADAAGHLGPGEEVPLVEFVQTLHFNLTLPGALDRYLVGIFGTVLLASLLTGILAHRRILKDVFRLRWGGSKRLTKADLHNCMAATYGLPVAATRGVRRLALNDNGPDCCGGSRWPCLPPHSVR